MGNPSQSGTSSTKNDKINFKIIVADMMYSTREGLLYLANGKRFFNCPIDANHNGDLALSGELPVMQFTSATRRHGSLLIGFTRGADAFWLHEAGSVQAFFGANRIEWRVADSQVAGLAIRLRVGAARASCCVPRFPVRWPENRFTGPLVALDNWEIRIMS